MRRVTLQESTLLESLTYAKNLLEETVSVLQRIRAYYLGEFASFAQLVDVAAQLITFIATVALEFGENYYATVRAIFAQILNLVFPPKEK
jgi:hypothetical protein